MTTVLEPGTPYRTSRPTAILAPSPRRRAFMRTVGPALLVSAGYVDPGNWGTDVASGIQFGYRLLWVLAAAMLAAVFLQQLAARLGTVSGHDLATLIRTRCPRWLTRCLTWPLLAALAVTEIVEVLGVVLGLHLLTGCSDVVASGVGAGLVLLVLAVPGNGARRLVYGCLFLVVVTYLVALCLSDNGSVVAGLRPTSLPPGGGAVAIGLVGSVIMPHNILLHTALARDVPLAEPTPAHVRSHLRRSLAAGACALALAFVVNVAITSVAVTAPAPSAGNGIAAAAAGLNGQYGPTASALFACTLLAAGLASATTGGMVSVDVLACLLPHLALPAVTRRLVFIVPAAAIACSPLPQVSVLVWSQVVLTCALPLVLVPLIYFVSRHDVMGVHVAGPVTRTAAGAVVATLVVAGALSLL